MNIFLRDALCNRHLSACYGLGSTEHLFELPLDSITGRGLREIAGRGRLPAWSGVKQLTPKDSAEYQAVALAYAQGIGVARVHLDALWCQQEHR